MALSSDSKRGLTVGPFAFVYEPDGDDEDTGIVVLTTNSGYRAETEPGVARSEWDDFVRRILRKP
jgi:hypothetical protein